MGEHKGNQKGREGKERKQPGKMGGFGREPTRRQEYCGTWGRDSQTLTLLETPIDRKTEYPFPKGEKSY